MRRGSHRRIARAAWTGVFAPLLVAAAPTQVVAATAHYIVFEVGADRIPEAVFHRLVELPDELTSISEERFREARQASAADASIWTLEVRDAQDTVLHRQVVETASRVRGEFHGEPAGNGAWSIEGHQFPLDRPAFVVRVPAFENSRLLLEGRTLRTFDLDALARSADDLPLAGIARRDAVIRMTLGGDPANRVDLLIMGDGYTAEAPFNADAADVAFDFFNITPYAEYENFYTVTTLFTASAQAGADHPPYSASCSGSNPSCCSDPAMQADPLAGTFVNTAFNARYCAFQIHRLLVVNTSAVYAAASAVPAWDRILVVVNDDTYGGSGGSAAVFSTHALAVDIARHEFGHSFTDLADEYDSPYPGYPACSDVTFPPCEANVTDETIPAFIKWEPWIDPSTPIPTPEGGANSGDVGLFEGARYMASGMYRPHDTQCLMHSLGVPFGEICAQEHVRVLYSGGWGSPAGGIDLIEPGTESPPAGGVVNADGGVNLSVGLLQPAGSPPLGVSWFVDGIRQPATGASFDFFPALAGTYTVDLTVEDLTPLVHPEMAGTLLQSSRSWTVDVSVACERQGGCGDSDGDGVRDDPCLWYACNGSDCQAMPRGFADGGRYGQADVGSPAGPNVCNVDGVADANDRFHALNCFANVNFGAPGAYPCEPATPQALNVDAGSDASCVLDGVCDANDAFHALNSFEDANFGIPGGYPCTCGGPAPAPGDSGIEPQEYTELALRAPRRARPGDFVLVDVHQVGVLTALRGYQLHLHATGGARGALELADIFVDSARSDYAFAGVSGVWSAFNRSTGQMLAGMDAPGGAAPSSGGYLATFTYRIPKDAHGTFVVEVRTGDRDPASQDRTFLYGAYARPIGVKLVEPARIEIEDFPRLR